MKKTGKLDLAIAIVKVVLCALCCVFEFVEVPNTLRVVTLIVTAVWILFDLVYYNLRK